MRPTELEPYKEEAWCGVRCSDGHGGGCVAVGEAGCRVEEYEGVMSGLGIVDPSSGGCRNGHAEFPLRVHASSSSLLSGDPAALLPALNG